MRFETATGSVYEIQDDMIRRVGADDNPKRADGEWVRLMGTPDIVVGESARLVLESLAVYGSDDYGNIASECPVTFRTTSIVLRVEP